MNNCKLGFECISSDTYYPQQCINVDTCNVWAQAWYLPIKFKFDAIVVNFSDYYDDLNEEIADNAIIGFRNWAEYFADYGYAEALKLPYRYLTDWCTGQSHMYVDTDRVTNIYIDREAEAVGQQLAEAGWSNASPLPYFQKVFYVNDTGIICTGIIVSYSVTPGLSSIERCEILNVGYASAIAINNENFRTDGFLQCQ